jgi:deoxyribodipyrimidine photo-lyase
VILCRFTQDLRIEDHAALAAAAEHGTVLPVLVIDDATRARLARSPRRAAFFAGAVGALDASLRERSSALVVRRGDAVDALVRLARESGARGVVWSARYDDEGARADASLRAELEERGFIAQCVDDAPAVPPERIVRDASGYRAFAPYFERWSGESVASYDVPILLRFASSAVQSEALPTASEFGAVAASADATPQDAHARVQRFLTGDGRAYAGARNDPDRDATSHLSAHLSFGTISLRTVARATREALDNPFLLNEERRSLRLFLRSLALRDFFFALSQYWPQTAEVALQERMRGFTWSPDHPALDAWRNGETGFALVDAGMRQLKETGWMHPQVRSVAASFLCFDLGVDWRVGRDAWDRLLIEDDPAIATGNWQWIAGVGADLVQYPRIYNPVRRQHRIDPQGAYVRRWIAELAHGPLERGTVPMLPLYGASGYPAPVVDHAATARAFLERYRAYVTSEHARQEGSEAPEG